MSAILSKLSIIFIKYTSRDLYHKTTYIQAFRSAPGCQTCMCKRGIRLLGLWDSNFRLPVSEASALTVRPSSRLKVYLILLLYSDSKVLFKLKEHNIIK